MATSVVLAEIVAEPLLMVEAAPSKFKVAVPEPAVLASVKLWLMAGAIVIAPPAVVMAAELP